MKKTLLTFICALLFKAAFSQVTIYYDVIAPSNYYAPLNEYEYLGDSTLKETAEDIAFLFGKAVSGSIYTIEALGNKNPVKGIILKIDTTLLVKQRIQQCEVVRNGTDKLTFTASSVHGVRFGVYSYLMELGFRFYSPGELWTITPVLATQFSTIINPKKIYVTTVEFHEWVGQGGIGFVPLVDSTGEIMKNKWDSYFRRNNLIHEKSVLGHIGEKWVPTFDSILHKNPCYIAERNGKIPYGVGATPSIYSPPAIKLWAELAISTYNPLKIQKVPYARSNITIEPSDATLWGNSIKQPCGVSKWPSPSDQQFILADSTTNILKKKVKWDFNTTCFAYDRHADTPSVAINPLLKVGIANGFQLVTSNNALRFRWRKKYNKLFEYDYHNLPDWTYQAPWADNDYFHYQTRRIRIEKSTMGGHYESTYSIFGAALHFQAWNKSLLEESDFNTNYNTMINDLFPVTKSVIAELFGYWNTNGHWLDGDLSANRHHFPLYFSLLNKADALGASGDEKKRITLLKSYMHYVTLHYELIYLKKRSKNKITPAVDTKVNELSNYFVKTYLTGIVNSFQGLNVALSSFATDATISNWVKYGTVTTYNADSSIASVDTINFYFKEQPFKQPAITDGEVEAQFASDTAKYNMSDKYKFLNPSDIIDKACKNNLVPKDTINLSIETGLGDNGEVYFINAKSAGSIRINYTPITDPDDNGINIALDSKDQLYSKEYNVKLLNQPSGNINFDIPAPGMYSLQFSVQGAVKLKASIITKSNYFYVNRPAFPAILGSFTDSLSSPRYVYIPETLDKIYLAFTADTTVKVKTTGFTLTNPAGVKVELQKAANDSDLFYADVDSANAGKFWQIHSKSTHYYTMVNTQNVALFLQPGLCDPLAIKDQSSKIEFNVYPNPNTGIFTVRTNAVNAIKLDVFNIMGQNCYHNQFARWSGDEHINLSELPNGVYLVKMTNGNSFSTQRIQIIK